MRRNKGRKMVTLLSVIVGAIGLIFMVIYHIEQTKTPLWTDISVAYGVVFWLFYLLDQVSSQFARFRHEAPVQRRPRPVSAGVSMPLPASPSAGTTGSVRLQRISMEDVGTLQVQVDDAVRELAALTDTVPAVDEKGHVVDWNLQSRLQDPDLYGFLLQDGTETVGCVFLQVSGDAFTLLLFYIAQDVRRRGIGRSAMDKIFEFAGLMGTVCAIGAVVPTVNRRAQKFLQACGFAKSDGEDKWVRKVGKN